MSEDQVGQTRNRKERVLLLDTRHSTLVTSRVGFTLVELMVAIGILVILFSLLFLPLMQGINFLQRGQASADAQNLARLAMEQMSREISEAMYVYDNSTYADSNRLDIVLPKYLLSDPPAPYAPGTRGILASPLQPENQIVSYYIRLRNPQKGRKYTDSGGSQVTNMNTLYRAQFTPDTGGAWRTATDLSTIGANNSHTAILMKEDCEIAGWTRCSNCSTTLSDGYLTAPSCGGAACGALNYIKRLFFLPAQILEETLTPNSDYTVYRATHGLWMGQPTISVLDANGALVMNRTLNPNAPYDPYSGSVNFSVPPNPNPETLTINGGAATCTHIPLPTSETVSVGGLRYTRVSGQPTGTQYTIDYTTGIVRFDSTNPPTTASISYRYRGVLTTDTVKVSYVTKTLMTIDMTVAKYDIASGKPMNVHLKNTVEVKNAEGLKKWSFGGN